MRAYAIDDFGQTGSLRDIPDPEPGTGQVKIRVAASGLNPFDNAVLQGYMKDYMEHRFPLVPGMDASGTIEALGSGVEDLAVGDEVFGSIGKMHMGEGTLAEKATMGVAAIARKPASIDPSVAAAIPTAGVTALTMEDLLEPSDGSLIVVNGATGGVGSYLVQLAAGRGARVVAVCSGANADYARKLGAAEVIDYTSDDVVEQVRTLLPDGIDAVADMHGDAEFLARLAELLREGGRVVSATGSADEEALRQRGFSATNVRGMVNTQALETLAIRLEEGDIVAPKLHTYPLSDAAAAIAEVGTGHVRGKIVVQP